MDTGVIIALILGVADILSAIFFGWIPSRNRERIAKMKDQADMMSDWIAFFVAEEEYLLEMLAEREGKPYQSLKIETRKYITNKYGIQLGDNFRPGHFSRTIIGTNNHSKE